MATIKGYEAETALLATAVLAAIVIAGTVTIGRGQISLAIRWRKANRLRHS
jgi:hypothetical protein